MSRSPLPHPRDWEVVNLAAIASKIGSGATPRGGSETYLLERQNFALVRSQNVFDRRFESEGLAYITDEQAAELRGVYLQAGDVLLNITGDGVTFGRSCIVPNSLLPACVNQHVSIIRLNPEKADAGFVLSYLTHPDVKNYIESFNAGGSRRAITKGHIESFQIALPPLVEQQAIGGILRSFDDKIELNRRMIGTLEGMARAMFKSWFVDFDPVRAKAEGSEPVLPKAVADLFPDQFQESEIGKIPCGWSVSNIGAIADVIDCLHSKKPERKPSGMPLLQLWNIRDDALIDMADTYWITEDDYLKWVSRIEACAGDCVITNVGRVGAVAQIPVGLKAALGRNMTAVRCTANYPYPTFLLQALTSGAMRGEIELRKDSGTILDALNVRNIPKLRIPLPNPKLLVEFEKICRPVRAKMEANQSQSATLASLREALLPKLISGELRILDAEQFVGGQV